MPRLIDSVPEVDSFTFRTSSMWRSPRFSGRKFAKGYYARRDADDIREALAGLTTLVWHPTGPLVAQAFDLADRTGRTVYDCIYLALAVQVGGQCVTADEKLINALATTAWASYVVDLRNV